MPQLEAAPVPSASRPAPASTRLWTGRVLSTVPILFMIFDGVTKLVKIKPVVDGFAQLGYPISLAQPIGVLALACAAVYAIPRTSVLGAVLLTGYLGGAIATQLRAGAGTFPIIFPLIFAAFVWGGLFLRDPRVFPLLMARR